MIVAIGGPIRVASGTQRLAQLARMRHPITIEGDLASTRTVAGFEKQDPPSSCPPSGQCSVPRYSSARRAQRHSPALVERCQVSFAQTSWASWASGLQALLYCPYRGRTKAIAFTIAPFVHARRREGPMPVHPLTAGEREGSGRAPLARDPSRRRPVVAFATAKARQAPRRGAGRL